MADNPCNLACTQIVKFMTDHELPASVGISLPQYVSVDHYRHIKGYVVS